MEKFVRPTRIIVLFVVLAILLSIYASSLYELQIINGKEYVEISANSIVTTSAITARRGDILDRNGVLLVSSTPVYNVNISRAALLKSDDPNGTILRLINTAQENGVQYNDTFPVTMSGPFSYLESMTDIQKSRLDKYLAHFYLDPATSASDLIVWMKSHYGLDYKTSLADVRRIIGIRYELDLRIIVGMADYIFAEDVGVDFISVVLEQDFPCVGIDTSYRREYHTKNAAQILGYTGLMGPSEYETYKELGYSMDAVVGRDGVEKAFEECLHGTDGSIKVNTNTDGAVMNVLSETPAVSGENVYLTIDIGIQAAAEKAISDIVDTINATRGEDEEKATGASAVVLDVKSGGVLASANYPTYDPATFLSDYSSLNADPLLPLWNRAMLGTYSPGSTFKMVSAFAGLRSNYLTRWFTITDKGKYTKYPSFQPTCWIYPGNHGTLDVVGALAHSCNYFFYVVGDNIGIDAIANAAALFGLGSKTGVEVAESTGTIASPAYKTAALNEGWWAADTLMAAIGQSYNMFTPIQLANYVATIANDGTRYKTTLLEQTKSADYSVKLYENQPVVASVIDDPEGYIDILQEGMRAVTSSGGTAFTVFKDYPVKVAAKTGTVQSDSATANTGVFVCYAPADDPKIAVAVVVEKGGSGSGLASAAKEILDSYFSDPSMSYTFNAEDELIK